MALAVVTSGTSAVVSANTLTVTKIGDSRDGACDTDCSLREALMAANAQPGADTIVIPAGTYVLQRAGDEEDAAGGDLDITDELTLTGAGPTATIIDANNIDRAFHIHGPIAVGMSGIAVTNGDGEGGGGIYNDGGTLTLTNCALSRNRAFGNGGGIYNAGTATLTMEDCTLTYNLADALASGGAIFNAGTATLANCTLSENGGHSAGGGLANTGTATLTNCLLSGNWAGDSGGGGGIFNARTAILTLEYCTLSENSGGAAGGLANAGSATLTNCTLSRNSAGVSGGGLINTRPGTLTLTNCTLGDNSAGGNGGGIFNPGGTLTLTNCALSGNSARAGGGIHHTGYSVGTLTNCTLSGNSASSDGGGIYNGAAGSGMVTLRHCTLSGNSAGGDSSTIWGPATVVGTILANGRGGRLCSQSLISNGYNLDDDTSCGLFDTGDLSLAPADLAPLGDYGGPTQTHALCTGPGQPHPSCSGRSAAIDAGAMNCPATDQRGRPRPLGSSCDLGAYESGFEPTVTPTRTPTTSPTGAPATTQIPWPCYGDCRGDGRVTPDELIVGAGIALGYLSLSVCRVFDLDPDGRVTVDEIVRVVNAVLRGCATPTARATDTSSVTPTGAPTVTRQPQRGPDKGTH